MPQQAQAGEGSGSHGRWQGGGVDIGSGKLDQCLNQRIAAGHKGTISTKCLAQRANQHRQLLLIEVVEFGHATAIVAQAAKAVGIVDHQAGVMLTGQLSQGRHRGDIAIHAEHTVGHNHLTSSVVFIQTTTEIIHIVVLIALTASTAQLAGIEQRGMVQTILKHGVLFAQQSTDNAKVGHVTVGE